MNSRTIWLLCAGIAALAVLALPRGGDEENAPIAPAAASAPAGAPTERAKLPPLLSPPADVAPIVDRALAAPEAVPTSEVSPELGALFARLRSNFESRGSKPNRFRLQRQLSELWADDPPVDVLLCEASDPGAPSDYRAHFAARLRNLGKTSPPGEREKLAHAMRESLARQPHGNAELAQALLAFDEEPASIRVVAAPLASSPPDHTTAGLLAALALSGSTESRRIRLEHARLISADPDRFPLSLQTSLPPLALRPELEVEPILQRVLATTTHFPLYETALQSCFYRPPASAPLAALQVAVARRAEFAPREQERLTERLRAGLLRWSRQADPSQPSPHADLQSLLHQLP